MNRKKYEEYLKKIDDYYDDLLRKVEIENDSKVKEFNEKIEDLNSQKRQIDSIKIDDIIIYLFFFIVFIENF